MRCLILALCLVFLCFSETILKGSLLSVQAQTSPTPQELVVLLHGIVRGPTPLRSLKNSLEEENYVVLNVVYQATEFSLEALTQQLSQKIFPQTAPYKKVHFVGYSMGGLLVRRLLNHTCPPNLGRVVLLATPNGGSEVADFLKNFWLYQIFLGPAGQELTTSSQISPQKERPSASKCSYGLGVIAGNRSLDPLSSWIIPGPDDGKVSVARTQVKGMQDFIVLPVTHLLFPQNKEVHAQIKAFLKTGYFLQTFHKE